MRVLLVYTDIGTGQLFHYQHGLGWLSAVLKKAGHQVGLIYLEKEISEQEFIQQVKEFSPQLLGFSCSTLQYQFVKKYARAVKEELGLPLVIGGIHPTVEPEPVLKEEIFDFLIRGEGEEPLLELVEALEQGRDFSQIKNLGFLKQGEVKLNPLREPVALDQLPFPDREIYDEEKLLEENDYQVMVMASRGCPFACTYCCNTVLSQLAGGVSKWHRRRSVENVLEEIEELHQRYPQMKSIMFMDEVFTSSRSWVEEFCREYAKRFTTPWRIFVRVGTVDYSLLKLMKESGLYSVLIGVESGDEYIRREVMNRKMSNEQIFQVFQWADELGLETWSMNMVGVPGDSEASIRRTIELNQKIRPDHLSLSIFQPFPGTPLYERCKKEGLLRSGGATSIFFYQPQVELPGLSDEKFNELFKEFRFLGWLWSAQKRAKGYYDLCAHFDQAKIKAGGENFVEMMLTRVRGEDRMSILIHPPSRVSWKVLLKPNSWLCFGASFSPEVWDKPGEGCWYLVKVKTRWRGEQVIFAHYLDPKHQPEQRKWNDFKIDLSKFGKRKIELILETKTDGANDWCVAFWSQPYLIQGGEDEPA